MCMCVCVSLLLPLTLCLRTGLSVVRVLKAASSNPPSSPLAFSPRLLLLLFHTSDSASSSSSLSRRLLRRFHLTSTYLYLSMLSPLLRPLRVPFPPTLLFLSLLSLPASVRELSCTRYGIEVLSELKVDRSLSLPPRHRGGMHLFGRNCRHLATWKMSFDQFALYDRVARVGSGSRSGCESSEWIRKSLHLVPLLFPPFFFSIFFSEV